jgi:two-component sensor histidine kinase
MGLGAKRDLEQVRRLILGQRSVGRKLGWAILAIAIPAGLRWLVDRGANGFPFVTFFPAVVLAAVFLDWRFAWLVVVGAAVCSVNLFQTDTSATLSVQARLLMGLLYFSTTGALILIGATLRNALAELDELHRAQATVSLEIHHRFKNMVVVVKALALQTVKSSQPVDFYPVLSGRLNALVRAAEIVSIEQEAGNIADIVASAIAPFQTDDRISLSGATIELEGKVCTALMLALHELATNAVKYGALSNAQGKIVIAWSFATAPGEFVRLDWRESDGPAVSPPERTGFGTRLLNTLPAAMRVERKFESTGVHCEIAILAPVWPNLGEARS